eukprot:TRINITY_DN479_c0_g1_i1.p1 TRINITY_DN479_c0_g1~~TRINITY_DN479_c0_g1_i1.p1  ORF type:complete len:327 (+),score=67.75 TRINITY_DN479_c0_g1_i1:56-982(+)
MSKKHVIVFQHGSHGCVDDFATITEKLKEDIQKNSELDVIIWGSDSCKGFGTDVGIMKVAETVSSELDEYLDPHLKESQIDITLVGHSMGGLILRAMLGMSQSLSHPNTNLHTYISIASPHLGIRQMTWWMRALAYPFGLLRSTTCLDLLQANDCLSEISNERHIEILKRFNRRILYSNMYDHLVSYNTSSLTVGVNEEPAALPVEVDPHSDIKKETTLRPDELPKDSEILNSFSSYSDFTSSCSKKVLSQFKSLRQLEWSLIGVDFSRRGALAHYDIIASPTLMKNPIHGQHSASHISDTICRGLGC